MRFKKGDIITNGMIEYEVRDVQRNQTGDWVYILYNESVAKIKYDRFGPHLPDGSIRWKCEQVDGEFGLLKEAIQPLKEQIDKDIVNDLKDIANDKLTKAIQLGDKMYCAAQQLTTDASHLHKAMEEWWNFKNNMN